MFKIAERSITRKNWDWRENPIRVRRNQLWKKNDTEQVCEILAVAADHVVISAPKKKKSHHLQKRDLLMFWKMV